MYNAQNALKTPFEFKVDASKAEITQHVLRDKSLSRDARLTLITLADQAKGFVPNREWIKKAMGFGEHICRRVMSELRQNGYLELTVKRDEGGKVRGRAWRFTLNHVKRFKAKFRSLVHWNTFHDDEVFDDSPLEKRAMTETSGSANPNYLMSELDFWVLQKTREFAFKGELDLENAALAAGVPPKEAMKMAKGGF